MAQLEIHIKPYLYIVKAVHIFRFNLRDCFSTVNSHLSPPTTRHRRLQKEVILTGGAMQIHFKTVSMAVNCGIFNVCFKSKPSFCECNTVARMDIKL